MNNFTFTPDADTDGVMTSYTLFTYDTSNVFHIYREKSKSFRLAHRRLMARFKRDNISMLDGCEPVCLTTKRLLKDGFLHSAIKNSRCYFH